MEVEMMDKTESPVASLDVREYVLKEELKLTVRIEAAYLTLDNRLKVAEWLAWKGFPAETRSTFQPDYRTQQSTQDVRVTHSFYMGDGDRIHTPFQIHVPFHSYVIVITKGDGTKRTAFMPANAFMALFALIPPVRVADDLAHKIGSDITG